MTTYSPKEFRVERIKSSGPGGQHRNKRETGIRITHIPTGLVALATERRSQAQNLELAQTRIRERIRKKLTKRKKRKKTKIPRSAQERRLQDKKKHGAKKEKRREVREDSPS